MTTEEIPKNNRKSRPVSVALTPAEREFIKAYGDGNVSRGIRAMVRVCRHLQAQAAVARRLAQPLPKDALEALVTRALPGGPGSDGWPRTFPDTGPDTGEKR